MLDAFSVHVKMYSFIPQRYTCPIEKFQVLSIVNMNQ